MAIVLLSNVPQHRIYINKDNFISHFLLKHRKNGKNWCTFIEVISKTKTGIGFLDRPVVSDY